MKELILKKLEEHTKFILEKKELTEKDIQFLLVVLNFEKEREQEEKSKEEWKNIILTLIGEREVKNYGRI